MRDTRGISHFHCFSAGGSSSTPAVQSDQTSQISARKFPWQLTHQATLMRPALVPLDGRQFLVRIPGHMRLDLF